MCGSLYLVPTRGRDLLEGKIVSNPSAEKWARVRSVRLERQVSDRDEVIAKFNVEAENPAIFIEDGLGNDWLTLARKGDRSEVRASSGMNRELSAANVIRITTQDEARDKRLSALAERKKQS